MSIIKKFKLRGYREAEWFWVYVYDSLKELREDASKYTGEEIADALAIVHPYTKTIMENGKVDKQLDIGIIRLAKGKIHTHIIAHELVHAAMWHYRLTQPNRKANFGEQNSKEEEDFGMIYAKYFSKMNKQLHRFGLWESNP